MGSSVRAPVPATVVVTFAIDHSSEGLSANRCVSCPLDALYGLGVADATETGPRASVVADVFADVFALVALGGVNTRPMPLTHTAGGASHRKGWSTSVDHSTQVLLITGPTGSGKSTLAHYVAGQLGWLNISEDEYWVQHGWRGLRTEAQERRVQQQVADTLLHTLSEGNGVVLEFILYKRPPNPDSVH